MANDKDSEPRERSDAERRARQCARLANLMRTLHLISGKGRWDAKALAEELECSQRTIHRLLATLSMAGVPWHFDEKVRAYRVRPGFKFPVAGPSEISGEPCDSKGSQELPASAVVTHLIKDGEALALALEKFLDRLRSLDAKSS